MRIVAKIGGAQIEQAEGRADLAHAAKEALAAGHELVLVHGGGNQIRALTRRLGIEDRYWEGLRVTDAETAEVVLAVLAGSVNKHVVAALGAAGVRACGVSGADGDTFTARPLRAEGIDLGYVGEVHAADARLVEALLAAGIVPVVATVAPRDARVEGPRDRFYNLNADLCAGPLAREFRADAMLFLTDVPGVLGASKQRLARLTPTECGRLREEGVITGGMIPKVDAALAAARAAPDTLVKIAPAHGPHAVLAALTDGVGTRFADRG
jgi:acetylglutamate kinase